MRLSSLFFGLSLVGRAVFAHPLDLPFEVSQDEIENLEKRTTYLAITGAPGTTVYPRLEIREMYTKKPNQFTLLILALQQWQAQAQSTATSYYQVAGIHGVPRVNWNNVGECSTCSGADGYCTHDSVLFPAWHRAYMALFEQEFLAVVNSIANSWPTSGAATTRATMQNAASTMRWAYWDWAAIPPNGNPDLPNIVSQSTVTINGRTGTETIENPLFRHDFTDPSHLYYEYFVSWNHTLRYPSTTASDAVSLESSAVSAFNNIRASLQDQVYQLFSTCTDYLHFSNDDAGSSSTSCSNSLEGIHNTVHTTSGGAATSTVKSGGHMYYLATAAFDPIFWLHHCNVDRLFAMWQTINPTSYGASQAAPHNTWTIAAGTTQNVNSPLTPFTKDTTGDFWTSKTVQSWNTTFHYTYPEFSDSDGSKAAIVSYVNKLYGPSATATAGSSKRTAMPDPAAAPEALPTAVSDVTSGILYERSSPALTAQNGSLFQYVANIKTPRYYLNGSYTVFLFMGSPASEDTDTWITDPNLIGPLGVLSQDGMSMRTVMLAGSIPLTRSLTSLVSAGTISSLTEAVVAPYLKSTLQWRVAGPSGEDVDPSTIPGFEISVYASTATQPTDPTCLPEWSKFIQLEEVTKNKAGGANSTTTVSS